MKLDSVGAVNSPCNFKRSILHACGAVLDDESHKHRASKRYPQLFCFPLAAKAGLDRDLGFCQLEFFDEGDSSARLGKRGEGPAATLRYPRLEKMSSKRATGTSRI